MRQPVADFWRSTPRRVSEFVEAFGVSERALDYRAGVIAAVIANGRRQKGRAPAGPSDFFASLAPTDRAPTARSPDEMREYVLQHFGITA